MAKHIYIHLAPREKVADAREMKFGLPVYSEEELLRLIRNGEMEAETDIQKGKRIELRKGSKRFQAYVKDAFSNYPSFEEMNDNLAQAKRRLQSAKGKPDADPYKRGNIERLTREIADLEKAIAGKKAEEARRKTSADTVNLNHLGEKRYQTYAAWKAACKASNPAVRFEGNSEICNALPGVGEWGGDTGVVYTKTRDAAPEVGEKVRVQAEAGVMVDGLVKRVLGNQVSVAYKLRGNNRQDDFHVTKVFTRSGAAFSADSALTDKARVALAEHRRLMQAITAAGKVMPGEMLRREKFLQEEVDKAANVGDASFAGSENEWKAAVLKACPGSIFRPHVLDSDRLRAINKAGAICGEYQISTKTGKVNE